MYPIYDHPDIESELRTGYPSWTDLDVEEEFDEDSLYEERREEDLW